MPAISRHLRDKAKTGHPCTTRAPVIATQFTVFANGIPMNRLGDQLKPHTILKKILVNLNGLCCKMHPASVKGGSRNVVFSHKADQLPGQAIEQTEEACTSTSNVFAGG